MSQPGDGVALSAARRVLDKVAPTHAALPGVDQELADDVELMVPGKDLDLPLASRAFVLFLHHLGVVLDDVRQSLACEDLAPQVVRLEAAGIGRIAGAVVPAFVGGLISIILLLIYHD
jgi:hypothetical protein